MNVKFNDQTDTITGAGGPDRVGGPVAYALTISGGGGADDLEGGAGGDRLVGGDGPDEISGGSGAATVESRDGAVDQIACGDGADVAKVDQDDGCAAAGSRRTSA